MGVNKVSLIGFVGKDPEFKTTESGANICTFSFATTEVYYVNEEKQEKTEWHRIVCFGKQAETINKYVTKGKQLYIEGSIGYRSYGEEGNKKYITEIKMRDFQFLGGGKDKGDNNEDKGPPPQPKTTSSKPVPSKPVFKSSKPASLESEIEGILDNDDVPF